MRAPLVISSARLVFDSSELTRCVGFVAAAYDRKRYGTASAAAGEHPLAVAVRQVGCAAGQAPADGDGRAAKKSRHA